MGLGRNRGPDRICKLYLEKEGLQFGSGRVMVRASVCVMNRRLPRHAERGGERGVVDGDVGDGDAAVA